MFGIIIGVFVDNGLRVGSGLAIIDVVAEDGKGLGPEDDDWVGRTKFGEELGKKLAPWNAALDGDVVSTVEIRGLSVAAILGSNVGIEWCDFVKPVGELVVLALG